MNKQEFSLKRVAFGVLIGVLSISTFAGIGRIAQANMFADLFAWLVADNCYYDSTGAYVCDDSTDGEEGCYYDSTGAYTCDEGYDDSYSCYDSSGNYICDDSADAQCESSYGADYYWDDYAQTCQYDGEESDSDSIQGCGECDGRCVQVGGTYSCESWDDQEDSSYDGDNYEDNQDQWQQDTEQMQEDMENMAEMLEEAANWSEDISDAQEETMEWQEDLLDRAGRWQEDLDDMSEDENVIVQPIYEEAIAYAQTAYDAIEEIVPEFDALLVDAEDTKEAMESAYEDYVNAGTGDSSAFWDAQSNGGVNDWRDVYRTEAEMWGRLANFYDFLIESTRIERETGMTAEEIGGEFLTSVTTAKETITTVITALEDGGELDSVIAAAEAEIAGGEDPWRAIDDVRDYFDDMRDLLDSEKDMWDSMEDAWDLVKDKEMENFKNEEMAMIREDIVWVTEELDQMEADSEDISEARALVTEIESLLDQIEATTDSDELEDLMKDLEKLGKKAEKELTGLGIDFGKYDKEAYVNSIDVNDPDALLTLLSSIPQNVLEQVISMLLANVNSTQLEDFIAYSEQFGDIGFFNSASIAYMDEETLNAMIEDKMAILAELDSKIASLMDEI